MQTQFPQTYPRPVLDVLRAMNVEDIQVVGTASLPSIEYSADVDAHDIVPNLSAKQFQDVIRRLKKLPVKIGDIKCGSDESKRVIPIDAHIKDCEVIGYPAAKTPVEFLEAKASHKEHILRWTPEEVLRGKKGAFTLSKALKTPGTVKVDTLVFAEGRYIEVTCVYITKFTSPEVVERELKESVLANVYDGNLFKAYRRIFSLARLEDDTPTVDALLQVFNSELGALYQILGDIQVLQDAGRLSKKNVAKEVEGLRTRLSTIRTSSTLLKGEPGLDKELFRLPSPLAYSSLERRLNTILQDATRHTTQAIGLYPIPHKYLP